MRLASMNFTRGIVALASVTLMFASAVQIVQTSATQRPASARSASEPATLPSARPVLVLPSNDPVVPAKQQVADRVIAAATAPSPSPEPRASRPAVITLNPTALPIRVADIVALAGSGVDVTNTADARNHRSFRESVPFEVWISSTTSKRILKAESNGRCRAVNPSGKYRGRWQMDADFWRVYGGLDFAPTPDQASCDEQDIVAYQGWLSRWWQPWSTY